MHRPTLGSLYVQALKRNPQAVALVDQEREYNYAELAARVRILLALIDARGYGTGHWIGLALPMGFDFLSWNMACHIAGLTLTDLPPSMSTESLVHRAQAGLQVVVFDPAAFGERAQEVASAFTTEVITTKQMPPYEDVPTLIASLEMADLILRPAPEIATLAFTGGTTGLPKPMGFSGEAAAAQCMMVLGGVSFPERPVALVYRTSASVMQLGLTQTLMRGGKLVTIPDLDFDLVNDLGPRHGVNILFMASRMIYSLPDLPGADWMRGQMQLIFHGGERVTLAALKRAIDRLGPVFVSGYGSMELGGIACFLLPHEHDPSQLDRLASAGRPAPGVDVEIRGQNRVPMPTGDIGEVAIRAPSQMECYIGNPEQTAQTIQDGWINTGDVGLLDEEHYLHIVDRSAFTFQSGDKTISPQKIDSTLCEHPAINMAITLPVPDAALTNLTCAAVTLRHGASVREEELKRFVASQPEGYSLHHIVILDRLPQRAGNLKIDRDRLLELLRETIFA